MRGSVFRIVFFLLILPILPFISKLVTRPSLGEQGSQVQISAQEEVRAELLMGLDLLVRAEHSIRSETGTYSRALGRVPDVLGSLTHYYRIELPQANADHLLVLAVGEGRKTAVSDGKLLVGDRVSVDDAFNVRTNFPVPEPPKEYLHTLARTVMNRIFANGFQLPPRRELDLWEGVYRRRFKYEVRPVSQGGRTIVALGLSGSVNGDVVEMESGADLFEWVYNHRLDSEQWAEKEMRSQLEKIYLAQRIHQDHTGFYAPTFKGIIPNWNGLSALSFEQSPFSVQEFQPDPTFGFRVEVVQRQSGRQPSSREIEDMPGRAWSLNGYGQVSEVSTIQGIMDQFDEATREITGEDFAAPVSKHRKRLVIDPIK